MPAVVRAVPEAADVSAQKPEGLAHRDHTHMPGQAYGRAQERVPSPRLTPGSPTSSPLDINDRACRAEFPHAVARSRAPASTFFLAICFLPEGLRSVFLGRPPQRWLPRLVRRCGDRQLMRGIPAV